MTATTFKVFYDAAIGNVTRFIYRDGPNEDDDYSAHPEDAGEGSVILSVGSARGLREIQAAVNAITGLSPAKIRYATIDQSNVAVNVVEDWPRAELAIDARASSASVAGGEVIASADVPPVVAADPASGAMVGATLQSDGSWLPPPNAPKIGPIS